MPSIKDVAAEAKVSLSTVSKVLNERFDSNISTATRDRVRLAARRMGYHPSALARGLAGKRMNTIGVVMAYSQESVTSDPYLGPCLDGILNHSKQFDQKVTLFLEGEWEDAIKNMPIYGEGHCDGLLIIIPRTTNPFLSILQERHPRLPFVLVGDSREDNSLTCVDLDNVRASREATEHLIQQGHRRIAAFCGNYDFSSNEQRLFGYRQALAAAGIPYNEDFVFEGEYHPEWGERNVKMLLNCFSPKERPTAIFGFCDAVAVGALRGLAAEGISVPEEMSVIGIDDIPQAAYLGLTTIRQSVRQIGVESANVLFKRIRGTLQEGHRLLLEPGLVIRRTTAGPLTPVLTGTE